MSGGKKALRGRLLRLQDQYSRLHREYEIEVEDHNETEQIAEARGYHLGPKGNPIWKAVVLSLAHHAAAIPAGDKRRDSLRTMADRWEGDQLFVDTLTQLDALKAREAEKPKGVVLNEADKQLLALALATLKIRRPGFGYALVTLAQQFGEDVLHNAMTFTGIVADEMRTALPDPRRPDLNFRVDAPVEKLGGPGT